MEANNSIVNNNSTSSHRVDMINNNKQDIKVRDTGKPKEHPTRVKGKAGINNHNKVIRVAIKDNMVVISNSSPMAMAGNSIKADTEIHMDNNTMECNSNKLEDLEHFRSRV